MGSNALFEIEIPLDENEENEIEDSSGLDGDYEYDGNEDDLS